MTDEYEELPCPDKNDFKVGDLVRVYDKMGSIKVTVSKLKGDYFIDQENDEWHFKQCRPLKKKEPPKIREFWVDDDGDNGLYIWDISSRVLPHCFKVQDKCDSCGKDFNK